MKMDELEEAVGEVIAAQQPLHKLRPSKKIAQMTSGMDTLSGFAEEMDDLEEALRDIESFGGPEAQKKAQKLIQSMRSFAPSVTLLGQVKSGKTSLLNALIGRPDFLPSDVNPWTSVVTSLHLNMLRTQSSPVASFQLFDHEEWDNLVENGGRIGELSSRAGADDELQNVRAQIAEMREKTKARLGRKFELLLGQTHNYEQLDDTLIPRYVCMGDDFEPDPAADSQGQFADITKSADIYLRAPQIPMPLCLRDTPGVNDTFMMREQITIRALRGSRVCLVVLSASQALSATDMALVRLISNVKSREVIIFVNRIDELTDPGTQIDEIRRSILHTLDAHKGPTDARIVFGSALWANSVLSDETDNLPAGSAESLATYAKDARIASGLPHAEQVWELSGLPELFEAIGESLAEGEGNEVLRTVRKRALNHLRGLQASSSVVSMRLGSQSIQITEPQELDRQLTEIENRARTALKDKLDRLLDGYAARVDRSAQQFLDRATDSLLSHLEKQNDAEVWQYAPDGLRILLRSSYQTLRRNIAKTCDTVLLGAATELTQVYQSAFGIDVDGFEISAPEAPTFPPPVMIGQTIALDLKTSWWKGWWNRRRGQSAHGAAYRKLIAAEIEPLTTELKSGQAADIRKIAAHHVESFLFEQRGILGDVVQKSQVSEHELKGLFGITAQEERDALFEILFEELSLDLQDDMRAGLEDTAPVRPMRPKLQSQGDAA